MIEFPQILFFDHTPIRPGLVDYLPQPEARQNPSAFLGQFWRQVLHFDQLIQSGRYTLREDYQPAAWLTQGGVSEEVWRSAAKAKSIAISCGYKAIAEDPNIRHIHRVMAQVAHAVEEATVKFGLETQFTARYTILEIQGYKKIEHPDPKNLLMSQFVNVQGEPLTLKVLS